MLHLPNNIKLIRKLSKLTQTQFGDRFELSEAQVKSYENGRAKPDAFLFLPRLSKYAGVSQEDLTSKKLTEKDISIAKEEKGEKVENGSSDYSKILSVVLAKLDVNHHLLLQLLSYETGMSVEELAKADLKKPLKIDRAYKRSSRS